MRIPSLTPGRYKHQLCIELIDPGQPQNSPIWVGSLEVGEHQDVEQLGAVSRTETVARADRGHGLQTRLRRTRGSAGLATSHLRSAGDGADGRDDACMHDRLD